MAISAPSSIPGSSTTEGPQVSGPSSLDQLPHTTARINIAAGRAPSGEVREFTLDRRRSSRTVLRRTHQRRPLGRRRSARTQRARRRDCRLFAARTAFLIALRDTTAGPYPAVWTIRMSIFALRGDVGGHTAPPCLAHPRSVFPVRCWSPGIYSVEVAAPVDPRRARAAGRSCDSSFRSPGSATRRAG